MDKTTRPVPREAESRSTFQRAEQWAPAGLIPEFVKKMGWAYRWVRTSMAGQADAMNVSSKMREGWEPVKPAEHPEMQLFADPKATHSDSIEVGGLMLMKTPEEFVTQRTAYYNKATQAQAEAVNNSFMKENDARMPLFSEKKTTTTFGKK